MPICYFCQSTKGVKGITCIDCGRSAKTAARALLNRINKMAENDTLAGNSITGAHHRAIEKALNQLDE